MVIARKFIISGEVQGVGFRFFAQRSSARHQIRGFVKNLEDGRVEVHAEGPAADVEAFGRDLAAGPRYSHVEGVEEIVLEPTGSYSAFRIER
jgi:acylphosphatase